VLRLAGDQEVMCVREEVAGVAVPLDVHAAAS
jgi:hypothetical protein